MPGIHLTFEPLQGQALSEAVPLLSQQEFLLLHSHVYQGFAARCDGYLIALTVFQTHKNRLVMEDLYVDPRYRLMGVGTELLRALCTLAESRHQMLLFSFEAEGTQNGFYRFLTSTRLFTLQRQDGCVAVASPESIQAFIQKYPRKGTSSPLFFQQSHLLRKEFLSHLEHLYPDIARELRTDHTSYSYREDLCHCSVSGGQIQAACFIQEFEDHRELKLLYSLPGHGPLAAKALLSALWDLAQCDPLPLRFTPVGNAALKLMENLCPNCHTEQWIYTAYHTGTIQAGGGTGV